MARDVWSAAAFFQNSSEFNLNELLKFVQEAGAMSIWAEPEDSFEDVITIRRKINWGKQILYALCVDPGGGAMAGKLMQGGRFAPGHRTKNIQGQVLPKHQTVTYQYDNFTGDLTTGEINAYMQSIRQELESKNSIFKSTLMIQLLGDGTSRLATPVGFGADNKASGASFTLDTTLTPLKIKLSTAFDAAGCAAWMVEGMAISFVYIDRDLNNDGVNEATVANGRTRFLSVKMTDGVTTREYDSFTVVRIKQSENCIEVLPIRETTTSPSIDRDFAQYNEWVPGAAGAITVSLARGRTVDGMAAATDTVFGAGLADISLFCGASLSDQYQTIMHPGYIHSTQAEAKLQLGYGWTANTEMSTLSKYVPTGLETLLCDTTHTVHGIHRANVLQHLPTVVTNHGRELTFNTFLSALTDHHNRNRKMLPEWTVLYMNPIVESSLIALSEASRILCDGEGVRGRSNKKFIKRGEKNFQFESSSCMRADKVYGIADGTVTLYDGQLKPVSIGGVSVFPQLVNGYRVDVSEKHANVTAECAIKTPRKNMVIQDFKTTALN